MPLAAERYISDGSVFLFETRKPAASQFIGTSDNFRFEFPGIPLYEAARHAPKGGISLAGKHFIGGQFIPGSVLAKATPAEKAKLSSKQSIAGKQTVKTSYAKAEGKPAEDFKPGTFGKYDPDRVPYETDYDAAKAHSRAAVVDQSDDVGRATNLRSAGEGRSDNPVKPGSLPGDQGSTGIRSQLLANRAFSRINKLVHPGATATDQAGQEALADFEKEAGTQAAKEAASGKSSDDERAAKIEAFKKDYHSKRVLAKLKGFMDAGGGISPMRSQHYMEAAKKVVEGMSATAVERMNYHVNDAAFFDSVKALTNNIRRQEPGIPINATVGGAYQHGVADGRGIMKLYLDGGKELGEHAIDPKSESQIMETASYYAHECGHAIDGPNWEFSSTKEWVKAWSREICEMTPASVSERLKKGNDFHFSDNPPLTRYAQTHESEGFAEFARLVHEDRSKAENLFPECYKLWKGWNL